jgi:hypothetical protein
MHCKFIIHAHCKLRHNSLLTCPIILLYILWTALFGFGGCGGVMAGLPLQQRVAKTAGSGIVFLGEEKMAGWDFGGAALLA